MFEISDHNLMENLVGASRADCMSQETTSHWRCGINAIIVSVFISMYVCMHAVLSLTRFPPADFMLWRRCGRQSVDYGERCCWMACTPQMTGSWPATTTPSHCRPCVAMKCSLHCLKLSNSSTRRCCWLLQTPKLVLCVSFVAVKTPDYVHACSHSSVRFCLGVVETFDGCVHYNE